MRSPLANFRSLLSGLFFISYGLAALPFALVLTLPIWNGRSLRFVVRWFYRVFVFFARLTRLYRVELDATTRAALANCRGKIIVANHLSLIDICILMAYLPDSTAIAKSAAKRNPFLSMVVRKIFILNDGEPTETVARATALIKKGVNIIVFPQGTRGGAGLKRGAARLALAAAVPIATFHLAYEPLILAKGQPWWDVGNREIKIRLSYRGECAAMGKDNHHEAVQLTAYIGEKIK